MYINIKNRCDFLRTIYKLKTESHSMCHMAKGKKLSTVQ